LITTVDRSLVRAGIFSPQALEEKTFSFFRSRGSLS
jgi:hypothetical protein